MDRNQITGLLLIFLMLLVYFQFLAPQPESLPQAKSMRKADSMATIQAKQSPVAQTDQALPDSAFAAKYSATYGTFSAALRGQEQEVILENKDIRLTLSSLGGKVKTVLLKNYKTFEQKPLILTDDQTKAFAIELPTSQGKIDISKLYFTPEKATSNSVTFRLPVAENQWIEQTYTLPATGFLLDYGIKTSGIALNESLPVRMFWQERLRNLEKDAEQSRTVATVNYYQPEEGFDYLTATSTEEESEKLDKVQWVSFKQKFFSMAIIANEKFDKAEVKTLTNGDVNNSYIKTVEAALFMSAANLSSGKANFKYYFGPNQYDVLKGVTEGFEKNVDLGFPVINWINRFVVIPVFHFLENTISNYGIIIVILVLLIKLILFPLSYKSYVSMAKMKVLKPELDAIKEKHGEDMAAVQQDQMKLYSQVGINPLSGCIPLLLQMPVLLAMFNFFPNSIELRQEVLWWANDLSSYDSIWDLSFKLPGYGSHVSLFTILMTASTLVLTWYNNQTSAVTGPMQYMSYIMPLVFMVILNSLPAGLSFYYLVSNVVSIGQQILIRNYVDEDEIRRKLEEHKEKNANKPKSSFTQRLEQAMRSAEEAKKAAKKK